MKVGLFTDIHSSPDLDRTDRIKKTLSYMDKVFIENKIETVFDLGDWFEGTKITSYNEIDALTSRIALFNKYKNNILVGNHECLQVSDLSNSMWGVFKNLQSSNWTVIDRFHYWTYEDKKIGLLPHGVSVPDNARNLDLLLHHQDIAGMFYPSGKIIEQSEKTLDISQGIAKLYLGGHLHIYQRKDSSIYLGATLHKSYDYIENFTVQKLPAFYILDLNTMELVPFLNPYSTISLKYTDRDNVNDIYSDLKQIFSINPKYEVYIRFVYSGVQYDCLEVEKKIKKLFNDNTVKIEFFRKVLTPVTTITQAKTENVTDSKNLEEMIRSYLRSKDPELLKIYDKVSK